MTVYTSGSTELIREARQRRGIGVRELARRAGVTPGAVSQWERSERQGTLRQSTLDRALAALGTNVDTEFPPCSRERLTRREDRVALELHRAVAAKLVMNPEQVLSVVPGNILAMRERIQGNSAQAGLDRWQRLTENKRLGELVELMLSSDSNAVSMRQTSPFLGVLTQEERQAAIERAQS